MTGSARFTPSLLDADTLERLFVHRHHHLDDALGRIERAATSRERAAKLFVGPRGAGKTHLLSLVYHRAKALEGFGRDFQLAWLPEDLWTIGSLDDLAAEIVDSLEPAFDPQGAEPVAAVIEAAGNRGPIVVLVENLDRILEAIGSDGQRQLRALLENHRPLLLLATSTRLSDELLDQAEPFHGFFDTTTLEPFDVEQAAEMLKRIAQLAGDDVLAERLDERRARNRLATIAHLAGGQPRVWALLAAGLTADRLDDLVSALVERFDDLTPYYQQQMDRLSLNERKAVRRLAAADGAVSVSELAERTGIEPRSLAKTITDLRRRGWIVRRTGRLADLTDQRRSYYQLAEPLARLAFQLKEARGKPVELVVEFLKAWFDHESLSAAEDGSELAGRYREAAHQSLLTDAPLAVAKALAGPGFASAGAWAIDPTAHLFHPDPKAAVNDVASEMLLDVDDAVAAYQSGDPEPLLRQPPAISQLIERQLDTMTPLAQRLAMARLGLHGAFAARWIPRLEQLCSLATGREQAEARVLLALHHLQLSQVGPADVLLAEVVASQSEAEASMLFWAGRRLLEERQPRRARAVLEASLSTTLPEGLLAVSIALEAAYQRSGLVRNVIGLWESTTDKLQSSLGPDHRDTLIGRNNLAFAHVTTGDLGRAIPLFGATLTDAERILGPEHPFTLTSRNNLAGAHRSAGDLGRAVPMFEATLADRERVLGPDHPSTLTSRNNLADAYESAGDLDRAVPMFEATLSDRERVLGRDHPSTLMSRNNLADAYESAGDLDRAVPMFEATLSDFERVLGPDHPDTLTSRNNLASAYKATGELDRAVPMYEATLADCERVLGLDHPDTLCSRNNLASAYKSAGDLRRAVLMFETTLSDRERVLGRDHPDTLTSGNNLASAYQAAGELDRAVPMFESIVADRERVLGPDHPDALISRNNLASAYESAGDLRRAVPMFEATLADSERVLGADHPDTLYSRNNLAYAYKSAGDLDRAVPMFEAVLADCERVLGPDHPDTLASRNNLARAVAASQPDPPRPA